MQRALIAGILVQLFLGSAIAADNPAAAKKAARWLAYSGAVRAEVMTADACPFDPAAVVLRVGNDPEKLAAFVRKNVGYEPYNGVVRGAAGTLASGGGSDWDRAVLLAALLKEAGYESTLKVIPRTNAQASSVVDAFLARKPSVAAMAHTPDPDPAKLPPASQLLARFNIPAENRLIQMRQIAADWRNAMAASLDAADAQLPAITGELASAKMNVGEPFDRWRAPLLAAAHDRVIVLLKTPDGPKILSVGPDADDPKKAAVDAAEEITEIPANQIATMTVAINMQLAGEGAPIDPVEILARGMPLADLFHTPLHLEIVPSDEHAAATPATAWKPDAWFANVAGFRKFQAILHIGHDVAASQVFDLNGTVSDVSADGQIAGAQGMGGAMGGFGALGGGGPAPVKTKLDELVLEITLNLPGERQIKSSRLLYGTLRPGMSPVFSADILAAGGPIGPATAEWLALDAITTDAPVIAAEIRGGNGIAPDSAEINNLEVIRMPQILHDWQLGRLSLAGNIIQSKPLTAMQGPAVILHGEQLTLDEKEKKVGSRANIDVIFDGQKIIPTKPESVTAAVDANERLGVASTALESVLLSRSNPSAAAGGPFNVAQEALLAGDKPGPAGGMAGGASPLAEWAAMRNETNRIMIFESHKSAKTWWAVDQSTGVTIGRGGSGEGQSAMEYLQVTKLNLSNLKCCLSFAQSFLGGKPDGYGAIECLSGLDNPGTYASGAGNVMGTFGAMEATGGLLATMGDCLSGAWDATH